MVCLTRIIYLLELCLSLYFLYLLISFITRSCSFIPIVIDSYIVPPCISTGDGMAKMTHCANFNGIRTLDKLNQYPSDYEFGRGSANSQKNMKMNKGPWSVSSNDMNSRVTHGAANPDANEIYIDEFGQQHIVPKALQLDVEDNTTTVTGMQPGSGQGGSGQADGNVSQMGQGSMNGSQGKGSGLNNAGYPSGVGQRGSDGNLSQGANQGVVQSQEGGTGLDEEGQQSGLGQGRGSGLQGTGHSSEMGQGGEYGSNVIGHPSEMGHGGSGLNAGGQPSGTGQDGEYGPNEIGHPSGSGQVGESGPNGTGPGSNEFSTNDGQSRGPDLQGSGQPSGIVQVEKKNTGSTTHSRTGSIHNSSTHSSRMGQRENNEQGKGSKQSDKKKQSKESQGNGETKKGNKGSSKTSREDLEKLKSEMGHDNEQGLTPGHRSRTGSEPGRGTGKEHRESLANSKSKHSKENIPSKKQSNKSLHRVSLKSEVFNSNREGSVHSDSSINNKTAKSQNPGGDISNLSLLKPTNGTSQISVDRRHVSNVSSKKSIRTIEAKQGPKPQENPSGDLAGKVQTGKSNKISTEADLEEDPCKSLTPEEGSKIKSLGMPGYNNSSTSVKDGKRHNRRSSAKSETLPTVTEEKE